MWTFKTEVIISLGGIICVGFLAFLFLKPASTTFHFETDWWALKTNTNQLLVSNKEAQDLAISRLFRFHYPAPETHFLEEISIGNALKFDESTRVHRLGLSLWKISTEKESWFFFGDNFEVFPSQSFVDSESDFWILSSSAKVPTNLKPPKKALINLSTRNPKKALKTFSEKTKTPILNLRGKDEIQIRYKKNQWQIQTTSYDDKNN